MPAAAVPRISPALQAKSVIPRIMASADSLPAPRRRGWMLRWAWVPAVAVVVLVSGVLIRRAEFGRSALQPALTMASKGPVAAATNSQQTPTVAPEPESKAKLAAPKPLARSAPAQTKPARTSDALPSALVVSRAAEQYPSAPMATATPKPLNPPAPGTISGAYKSAPAAVPPQNSFVEGEAPNASGLVARSHADEPQMGLLPAIATRRQWRITPDGHLERSTTSGNWIPVLADQPATFHVVSVVGDNVWAGGSGGVLFHSGDGGQNWSKRMLYSPSGVETGAIVSVRFSDALHGVITTDQGSRWNTSDGGVTWTKE